MLSFPQIMIRDMPMAATHLAGALQIISVAGGIEALELSGLVLFLLASCVYAKKLLDSDPRIEIPCSARFWDQIGYGGGYAAHESALFSQLDSGGSKENGPLIA
jgi:hypothetical protein